MGRVWALAGAGLLVILILYIFSGFVGLQGMLTIGPCIGAGTAAAYVGPPATIARGMFMFAGAIVGGLGFAVGALVMPDNELGLALGASVPILIAGLATMWSRKQSNFLAMTLGAGATAAVYANVFNLDPQALNVSMPIALGQTILPLGLGFLSAVLVRGFVAEDPLVVVKTDEPNPDDSGESETLNWDAHDADTAQLNLEETR